VQLPDGSSIIERMIEAVADSGIDTISIIANDAAPYRALGREVVPDSRPGLGPLGGIEAALQHYQGRADGVLFLPCDLPGITSQEPSTLREAFTRSLPPVAVVETGDGFWHPLCAVVRIDVLESVRRFLNEGRMGVYQLWRELEAMPVRFEDERRFFNVNTPEDLDHWLAEAGPGPSG
jgi:molybdopterin-guanine dinucleotide biosynthesis protein A